MSLKETQYETILAALADKIKEQERTIALQRWQIEDLEKALTKAFEEAENKKGNATPKKLEIR